MTHPKVPGVHRNAEYDRNLMYIEMENIKSVKMDFAKMAEKVKYGDPGIIKSTNYFSGINHDRKQTLGNAIQTERQNHNLHNYQIRVGLEDLEVHKKIKGPNNYYKRIPLNEIVPDISSPPAKDWKAKPYQAPAGRQLLPAEVKSREQT